MNVNISSKINIPPQAASRSDRNEMQKMAATNGILSTTAVATSPADSSTTGRAIMGIKNQKSSNPEERKLIVTVQNCISSR
jgi:hypothetical protein